MEGHFQRQADGVLEGWCWSRDRPGERLAVEILADDVVVASAVAGAMRRDLARDGVGDGRHAFKIPALDADVLEGVTMLSAREGKTGKIFARIRIGPVHRPVDPRLDRLADELAQLRIRLGPRREEANLANEVRAGFASVGARLASPLADPAVAAARSIERSLRGIAVPIASAPACSIVLWAGGLDATGRAVAAIAPALRCRAVELVVVDDGRDPRMALLTTAISGATVLRMHGHQPLAAVLADATERARGRHVVVLDASREPSAAALIGLIDGLANACSLVFDDRVAERASRTRLLPALSPRPLDTDRALPLLVAFDRTLFERVGGLDPALDGDGVLGVLDFCLKARTLGVAADWLRAPAAGPVPNARREPASRAATELFRSRWRLADLSVPA